MSLDAYISDRSAQRKIFSSEEDFQDVAKLRRSCDAMLIGAETLRADNPTLAEVPLKVVLSRSGNIPPDAKIFSQPTSKVLIFGLHSAKGNLSQLANLAEIKYLPENKKERWSFIFGELEKLSVKRLLIEGGANIAEQILDGGYADELRLSIAPVILGKNGGKKFNSNLQSTNLALDETKNLQGCAVSIYRSKSSSAHFTD